MGGDHGLVTTIPASIQAIRKNPHLHLFLVGEQSQIKKHLQRYGKYNSVQLTIVHTSEIVGMDELPSHALRNKKDSSMRVALNLIKEGKADACVSAGNTGALMATARFVLKTLTGIDRPAIISELPTKKNKTRVVDLGANIDSCAEHLFQFAVMGTALIQAVERITSPKIALLNIGVEEIKGNDQVKRTAHMLSDCSVMNYVGYVEGDEIFSGNVDLVVCDGFVGNVALKVSEGLANFMIQTMKEAFRSSWIGRLVGLLALPFLKTLKNRMDPARYNGASLLGLNGIVIKSHGGASSKAFLNAIEEASRQASADVVALVKDKIADFVHQGVLS